MNTQIPIVVDDLYRYFVTDPDPAFWPDYIRDDPVKAHGLCSFYRGLCLGMQISHACMEIV